MYARVQQPGSDAAEHCRRFRQQRDALFRMHPQSALSNDQKPAFHGLRYYDYNPALRFLLPVDPNATSEVLEVDLEHDGMLWMRRFGTVHVPLAGQTLTLSLFWLLGYGDGLFLPFGDATNGHTTYGGGRYLLDTNKHADLGQAGDQLVIDFNNAYNPFCAYNSR